MGTLRLLGRCAQVFIQGDFKVHQLVTFGVVYSAQIEMRPSEWRGDPRNIEKHKPRLSRMRLHGTGSEAGIQDFILSFAVYRSLDLGSRVRKRDRRGALGGMRQTPIKVIFIGRRNLSTVSRDQLCLHPL